MTFLFSLIGGLLIAIAIQLVFANLGIALGLSVLKLAPAAVVKRQKQKDQKRKDQKQEDQKQEDKQEESSASSETALPITHLLGFGVAAGFSGVIFVSTLFSVEFSELLEPRRGIIFGLIFWATYWLLFVWISSTTLAGIADSLIGTALKGGRQLVSTIKQAVDQFDAEAENVTSAESGAESPAEKAVLEELIAEVSQLVDVQQALPTLLESEREALLAEICDRTNLSSEAAETITRGLESEIESEIKANASDSQVPSPAIPVAATPSPTLMSQLNLPSWQQILRRTLNKVDLSDWDVETIWEQLPLESAQVKHLSSQLVDSVTAVLPEATEAEHKTEPELEPASEAVPTLSSEQTVENTVKSADENIAKHDVHGAAVKAIQSKIISFCRYTNTDSLTAEKLSEKVFTQLEEHSLHIDDVKGTLLDVEAIESVLSRRRKLTPLKKQQLVEALQTVWPTIEQNEHADSALANEQNSDSQPFSVQLARSDTDGSEEKDAASLRELAQAAYKSVYQRLEDHLQSVDWSTVSLEDIKPEINLILEQIEREGTLRSLDWSALGSRIQLRETAKAEFTAWLQTAWLSKAQALRPAVIESTQTISRHLADQITDYLQHQDKSALQPEQIAKKLTRLVSHSISILPHPQSLIEHSNLEAIFDQRHWNRALWDKATWKKLLEDRKDLSVEEIQQILDWGERVWQPKVTQVGSWLQVAQSELREHLSLPDVGLPDVGLPDTDVLSRKPLEEAKQKIVGQIELAQEKAQEKAIALKEDLQQQAEATRRQVAIAAWWLFIALVSSGSAAAGAGWLAAVY